MTKSKHTARALTVSVLSMILCVAMLVGSTFAWFTDSVTSGKNKIVAGNLDVELEYAVPGEDGTIAENAWKTVEGATDLFKQDTLWEPGHAEVVYLRIRNAGTLALKYKFGMNIVSETEATNVNGDKFKLSQYLQYGVVEGQQSAFADRNAAIAAVTNPTSLAAYSKEGTMLAKTEPQYLALVVFMPETVGNEANYRGEVVPTIELGLNLVATQTPDESDSFGNQYDAGAAYPVVTQDAFNEALETAKPGDKIYLENRTYEMPEAKYELPEGVSIIGKEGTVISVDGANPELTGGSNYGMKISSDNVTIHNVEIIGENIGIDQYDSAVRITGNNVILDNVKIHAKKEDLTAPRSAAAVIISNTSGADNVVTIKNCDLFSTYKAIHIVDGTEGTVNIEGCTIQGTFTLNANTNSVYSIYAKDTLFNGWVSYGESATRAVFENCEFTPYMAGKYLVAYADTDFINCTFDPGFFPETKNGRSKVMTFTDCYRGDTKITAENILAEFHVDNDSDSIDQANGWTVIVNGTQVLPVVEPPDENEVPDPFA